MDALTVVKDDPQPISDEKPNSKRKRRRIQLIETPPQPDWTIRVKDDRGQWVWYTRVEVTGLLPRRYGPFKSRGQALLFLDDLLNVMGDAIDSEGAHLADEQAVTRRYAHRFQSCMHEDALGQAYLQKGVNQRKPKREG